MRELIDFEEDLYKCSRCGLCQSVCPVYKTSLNECAVSKGKFNMLNGVLKGEISLTKNMKKYLDMCTGCNACKNFCPSAIDAAEIIRCAKHEFYKNNKQSLLEKTISSYFLLKSALIFSKICFGLYRFLNFDKIVNLFEKFLLNAGCLGKNLLLLNFFAKSHFSTKNNRQNQTSKTAIYFEGCVNQYINPQTENAVFEIFKNSGIKLIKKNFDCCGVTYLSDGNISEFKKIAARNMDKIDNDVDCIVTDCASCNAVLRAYNDYFDNEAVKILSEKTVSVIDFIKGKKFACDKHFRVAVHVPCHEKFDFKQFVKNIDNIEFVEVESSSECCGFSGSFAIKNNELSKKIAKSKAVDYINAKADIVLTTCPSCLLGLEQGFIETKIPSSQRPEVMNLFVFVAKYCKNL